MTCKARRLASRERKRATAKRQPFTASFVVTFVDQQGKTHSHKFFSLHKANKLAQAVGAQPIPEAA